MFGYSILYNSRRQFLCVLLLEVICSAAIMSCAIHTHTPAKKSSTNFLLYPFLLLKCSANRLGHGHGYKCHSPDYVMHTYIYITTHTYSPDYIIHIIHNRLGHRHGHGYKCHSPDYQWPSETDLGLRSRRGVCPPAYPPERTK